MYLVINLPKVDDNYRTVADNIIKSFGSLSILNSLYYTLDWITPTCAVLSFKSIFVDSLIIDDILVRLFKVYYSALGSANVFDFKTYPFFRFNFLNIIVSLKQSL